MSATTSPSSSFPFEFVPQRYQDADVLRQLEFVPGLKDILMLRQVHALEHATVWVLNEPEIPYTPPRDAESPPVDNGLLGGMSTERGFYLYGRVRPDHLRRAVQIALQRITEGEWNLAVHPRCGTNLSVGMLLTAGLVFGINTVLPRGPLEQLLGVGLAATAAAHLAPDLGSVAQRYLTTAIPFNLEVEEITPVRDLWGRPAQFVSVRWVDVGEGEMRR